jgi:hypothetical protein
MKRSARNQPHRNHIDQPRRIIPIGIMRRFHCGSAPMQKRDSHIVDPALCHALYFLMSAKPPA